MTNLRIKNLKMKNCQDLMFFVILWGDASCGHVTVVEMSFQSKCSISPFCYDFPFGRVKEKADPPKPV